MTQSIGVITISDPFIYRDPILFDLRSGKINDPYVPYVDIPYKVIDSSIQLQELPATRDRVKIKDPETSTNFSEISSGVPNATQFIVDYTNGIVKFNAAVEGKTFAVTFYGRGNAYMPASRIWTKQIDGNVIETLEDLIGDVDEILEEIDEAITNANDATDAANEAAEHANTIADNTRGAGVYNPSTTYQPNNFVTYEHSTYMALGEVTGVTPGTDPTKWQLVVTGSVTQVTSANADISVATSTTTPVLTLNSGTGANQIVKRNSSGVIPGNITGNAATVTTNANLTGDITSVGNVTSIAAGVIVDADINASAAIAWSKISKTGSSLADLVTRSASDLSSGTLPTGRLPALTGDITMSAGSNTTAIAAGVIVNADINASAAIDATKIANGSVSNTEFQYLDGVTGSIQTQLNSKQVTSEKNQPNGYAGLDSGGKLSTSQLASDVLTTANHNSTGDPHTQYVAKSGSVMTGNLSLTGTSIRMARPNTSGGWARGIDFYNLDYSVYEGAIGVYGSGDNPFSYIYLAPGAAPHNGNGLRIKSDGSVVVFTGVENTVLHTGNHNSTGDPHTQYVQKTGGTFTGSLIFDTTVAERTIRFTQNGANMGFYGNATRIGAYDWQNSRAVWEYTSSLNTFQINATSLLHGTATVLTSANHNSTGDPHTQYAPKASPAFSGTPTAPTPAAGTNNTQIATTAFVVNHTATIDGGSF